MAEEIKQPDQPGLFESKTENDPPPAFEAPEQEAAVEKPPAVDDGSASLRAQIDALRQSEQTQRQLAEKETAAKVQAMQQAQERHGQVWQYHNDAVQSRILAVDNAISAANAAAEQSKQEIEAAIANGDARAQADAYERLATAKANLTTLESGKSNLQEQAQQAQAQWQQQQKQAQQWQQQQLQQQQQQQSQDPIERLNLPAQAKTWLRAHPEFLTDHRKNAKLQALHWDVVDEGHAAFSDGYYKEVEARLGMNQGSAPRDESTGKFVRNEQRSSTVSAPVSREVPSSSGARTGGQVTLTAAEREAARDSGISEKEYAKQKQHMIEAKQNGLLQ